MKNTFFNLPLIMLVMALFAACTENIDMSNQYTFTEYTITSYLDEHESTYSEYIKLLKSVKISSRSSSTLYQLLSARGNYTVFAPTNEAIHNYLDSLTARGIIPEPSWDAFPNQTKLDSIQDVIVFNSIIDGGDDVYAYQTSTFPEPNVEFPLPNMFDRKLVVTYGSDPDSIFINGTSLVSLKNRDIPAINGYIHAVNNVIAPSNETLADVFQGMLDSGKGQFLVMAKLLRACGLLDTLSKTKDEVYENMILNEELDPEPWGVPTEGTNSYIPQHRKYGFTIFAETDDFWRNTLGKNPEDITVEDVRNYIQSQNLCPGAVDDTNYKKEENALNQFVTYHLLPMKLPKKILTIHFTEKGYFWDTSTAYTIPVWEIYITMGKRRLLKIYEPGPSGPDGFYLNRFPNLNNGRHGNYKENGCDSDKEGIHIDMPEDMSAYTLVNAVIYPINRVLAYDDDTRDNFQRNRLRFDITSIFPEFMNNDIRPDLVGTNKTKHVAIPTTEVYPYLDADEVEIGKQSKFNYLSGRGSNWANYQGDELNVIGRYELTFRLPPVPRKGTYEIRYLVGAGSSVRSMCQVYFGTNKKSMPAMGIPLDLRMGGLYRHTAAGDLPSIVGWETDVEDDDDYNAEVEKKMRANGFMKGPNYYHLLTNRSWTARDGEYTTRRIIVTATMEPDQVYYLRFKNVLDDESKQFYMDFIELCPKEVYDNPYTPEDIW